VARLALEELFSFSGDIKKYVNPPILRMRQKRIRNNLIFEEIIHDKEHSL
jgi:hypothetical protein